MSTKAKFVKDLQKKVDYLEERYNFYIKENDRLQQDNQRMKEASFFLTELLKGNNEYLDKIVKRLLEVRKLEV